MDDVRGDFLRPPNGTTPAAVIAVFDRSGCTATGESYRGVKKDRDCTIHVEKTNALISFAATAKLICAFVFVYADCWFSRATAEV